ncbi:MAG: DUF2188 domain-containing protein [Lewinellaceae bacterium]|nr:DUF2188 domain-containing protein [Phaeodactylibacter sp.]MCB9350489.1 DUF2188 domain-containing protein [Lewinellaceae bacterium]
MADIRQSTFWANLAKKVAGIVLKNLGAGARPDTHHQHVVPHPKGWAVKGEGNERYTAIYPYQDDAIERAREIAQNYGADVIIHRKDGTIRDRINYG